MFNTVRYLILPVLHVAGLVFMWFAGTMLLPLGIALVYDPEVVQSFVISTAITFLTGMALTLLTKRYKRELSARHGFLLVTLIWTFVPLFSTIPFLIEMPSQTFSQLYFEMMSCLTTTGATVLTGLDHLPLSLNGCFLSWLGGMGLIVLSVAILPLLGIGGSQIIKAETSGPLKEQKLTPRIADTAKALWLIYFGISLACAVAYHMGGMEWSDAIMHMMTTVSLSGISAHDSSYAFFNSARIDYIACFFMAICGFNFSLHFLVWNRRNIFLYFKSPEAVSWMITMIILVLITFWVLFSQGIYNSWEDNLRYAMFSAISVASTTGFSTVDYSSWPAGLPIIISSLFCNLCRIYGGRDQAAASSDSAENTQARAAASALSKSSGPLARRGYDHRQQNQLCRAGLRNGLADHYCDRYGASATLRSGSHRSAFCAYRHVHKPRSRAGKCRTVGKLLLPQ